MQYKHQKEKWPSMKIKNKLREKLNCGWSWYPNTEKTCWDREILKYSSLLWLQGDTACGWREPPLYSFVQWLAGLFVSHSPALEKDLTFLPQWQQFQLLRKENSPSGLHIPGGRSAWILISLNTIQSARLPGDQLQLGPQILPGDLQQLRDTGDKLHTRSPRPANLTSEITGW